MDLWEALRILARRWFVVVPLLLLTAFGAVNLYSTTEPEYTTTGSILLRGPSVGQDEASGLRNPYLDYGNMAVPARVVVDIALTPSTYHDLTGDTGTTFELGLDTTTSAPLVVLNVTGPSPDAVVTTAQGILEFFSATLRQRQLDAGAPENTLITTEVVTPPVDVLQQNASRLRMLVGVAGVGVLFSVGMAFLVEAILRIRARGRSKKPPAKEAEPPADTTRPVSPPAPVVEPHQSSDNLFRPIRGNGDGPETEPEPTPRSARRGASGLPRRGDESEISH
ncbi:hypothetical protein [Jiangella anatolica]|uniref:Polysaccharide chain length determinant N-terminal domain-containing protein n=1 Tax=Jiangella anatolica TaxID=2670374 RepID=A0A2W2BHX9_9ACTN|nr:hypothetical protein [Jiangella anatolica]PZF79914.1 hypothetical protein C1I92_28775 [Jiangella anatolica]